MWFPQTDHTDTDGSLDCLDLGLHLRHLPVLLARGDAILTPPTSHTV